MMYPNRGMTSLFHSATFRSILYSFILFRSVNYYVFKHSLGIEERNGTKPRSFPTSSLWNDLGFDVVEFTGSHILFFKEYLGNYRALYTKLTFKLSHMKDNHLLRSVDVETCRLGEERHVENEMRAKLKSYDESYAKSHRLLESLQKGKEIWVTKLGTMETKAKELAASEET